MHSVWHFFPNSASARLLLLVLLFPWCWGCCCSYSRFFPPLSSGVRITLSWPSTSFPPRLFQSRSLSVPALLSDYRKCHSCLKCTYFIWGIKLTIYLLSITFPYSQLLKNKVEHLGRKSLIYKWLFLLAFFFNKCLCLLSYHSAGKRWNSFWRIINSLVIHPLPFPTPV